MNQADEAVIQKRRKLGRGRASVLMPGLILFWCCIGVIPCSVQAALSPLPELDLRAELRVPVDTQNKAYHFVPASTLVQGQEIFYTLRIHNPTDKALSAVQVVQPVPSNTRYVAGSATGAGAEISFSIDAGVTFAKAADLQDPSGSAAPYTHIRWQLPYPLAPGAVLLARFRAVFQ